MNILTRGTRPFRLLDERHDLPYPAGEVEFLDDKAETPDAPTTAAARAAYAELVEQATDHELTDDELAQLTAYRMAATVDFGLEAKQGLLDLRSENARLRLVTRLFRAAMRRTRRSTRAVERKGPLRIASHEPARISTRPATAVHRNGSSSSSTP